MIEIGYKFPHNGARVILTAPAENDSIIVLCKEEWSDPGHRQIQWITGRVYVQQLPRPESWESGTYSETLEDAVKHFMDRAGIVRPGYDEPGVQRMVALARNVEKRLDEINEPRSGWVHMDDTPCESGPLVDGEFVCGEHDRRVRAVTR